LIDWSVTAKVNLTGVVYTIVKLEVRPAHPVADLDNLPERDGNFNPSGRTNLEQRIWLLQAPRLLRASP
jgi:hypothetical protein